MCVCTFVLVWSSGWQQVGEEEEPGELEWLPREPGEELRLSVPDQRLREGGRVGGGGGGGGAVDQ